MEQPESEPHFLEDPRVGAELEKLNLEIRELKSKLTWQAKLIVYMPAITVLVGAAAFFWGIYQFQAQQRAQQDRTISEQEKDRNAKEMDQAIKIQDQIRIDTDELLQFTSDDNHTVARALFLLEDLRYLLRYQLSQGRRGSDVPEDQTRTITESLVNLVKRDCDFARRPRDVHFEATLLQHWQEYREYLKSNVAQLEFVLNKHLLALGELHSRYPAYVETMAYDPPGSGAEYYHPTVRETHVQELYHFVALVDGFAQHLELLGSNTELKKQYVRDFQNALCNRTLTQHRFDQSFDDQPNCGK